LHARRLLHYLQEAAGHNRPRLWWCVTGELGFLPIHAAGEYGGTNSKCITNYVVSSYIPTLSSLTKARSGWEPIPRSSVAGLLVCETYADHGLYKDLPGADKEVQLVRAQFASAHARILNAYSPHTSLADLRSLLQGNMVHVLHLACHGVQDVDPLNSALLMHDGKLTIENMMHLDLPHAVLAYLSACETAKGDRNAPDQAVHLAASMLFCGFRSVVGTMW
jgi:CHAT domain-containing protein